MYTCTRIWVNLGSENGVGKGVGKDVLTMEGIGMEWKALVKVVMEGKGVRRC
jgi:hypothetical protein